MKTIRMRLATFLILTVIWLLVMYPFSSADLALGAGIALFLSLLPLPGLRIYEEISPAPRKIIYALIFLLVFVKAVILSNLDVAFRVLKPSLPINPGIVRVKTKLKSRLGRLFLANAITLTPGTITVEAEGEDFYIHWIDVASHDVDESTSKIVSGFEKYLEVIFG
ncbi:MAG: Na+/H+ antiporter subunit E [Spirochaetales bacterium]|nr:Na+/H+ antiporter subunit E [Spirochaetales bacterium]